MPVRHRQQQAKFKLLNGKFIFLILFLLWVNLDKAFRFGKRFLYTIFLELAIMIFYSRFVVAFFEFETQLKLVA